MFPRVTLILGGAASGKSEFAENLVERSGRSKVYIATSTIVDDETKARVARHAARRGGGWQLVEAPLDPVPALAALEAGQIALLDCATMWLSNRMLAGDDLETAQAGLLEALANCAGAVVVVSNEVGQGIVPDNALARRFREAQGRLNIALAGRADCVALVVAGLPLVLKGRLP